MEPNQTTLGKCAVENVLCTVPFLSRINAVPFNNFYNSSYIVKKFSNENLMLKNRTAVVTGASSGIGRETALELARQGANVIVHANRNEAGAKKVCEAISELGSQSHLLMANFEQAGNLESFVQQSFAWKSGVDFWFNNAGVDVLTGSMAELSFEQKLDKLFQVDVKSTMLLSRLVGQKMVQQQIDLASHRHDENDKNETSISLPSILNMGWDQSQHGMKGDSGEMFGAIKGAVIAFSKSLAKSLAPYVRVNCVAPGWINTSWGENASEYWQARATGESLLRRWGTPSDIAKTAAFLASDQSSFINGQVVNVNGGFRFMDSDN